MHTVMPVSTDGMNNVLRRKPKLFTLKLEIYSLSESDADCMNRKILEICNHNGNEVAVAYVPEEGEMK